MSEMKSYGFKRRRGYDDLVLEYAWIGNSQGDESVSNSVEHCLNNSWMTYVFGKDVPKDDQEAINKEVERRKKINQEYIEKLKSEGRYGEEYEITIHLKHNPLFDTPNREGTLAWEDNTKSKVIFIDHDGPKL
jgi:hypothetical protein